MTDSGVERLVSWSFVFIYLVAMASLMIACLPIEGSERQGLLLFGMLPAAVIGGMALALGKLRERSRRQSPFKD